MVELIKLEGSWVAQEVISNQCLGNNVDLVVCVWKGDGDELFGVVGVEGGFDLLVVLVGDQHTQV